ncbi:S41 family peptidase [Frigoriglobus tundricola]|uniref:Tricorn protease homolog n=1 Tax=Frigoriglobus tundricola TaxID=2774151 RepID=A0A6M5Z1C8_9BACT|nr:S41 family peptidase [Frigoriglobus tundricola]QJW99925.1 S41 family peptidase [Frigoriglobus tundricola]
MLRFALLALAALAACACPISAAPDEARLLRFPAIHGDQIAFTYAGDLYTVTATGGTARRLTSHPGFEMFPRFSPDGKSIAFTAQYDGNTEVFVVPAAGGEPRRLTYTATLGRDEVSDRMGPNNIVMGWTPDGKGVLFRSRMRSFNDFIGQLYTVSVEGGLPEELPLPRGGFASYSPDGKRLVYNRVFREFRTWKRYRGGMADDVWLYDFATKKTEQLTDDPGQDIFPMFAGGKIYFLSDRGKEMRFNLYSVDPATKKVERHTDFTEFDIKFPSASETAIVFENGGYIHKFDAKTGRTEKVAVTILEDRLGARGGLTDVSKSVAEFEISPDGKRALFGARGDVFTVPAGEGVTRNLTRSPGAHERSPKWSPDGKSVAFVSDATGEDEIHVGPADGSAPAKPVTSGADTYKYEIAWSPDSKKVLWADKKLRLQFVEVESKKVTLVNQAKAWEIREYAWAPDSKWIAFARQEADTLGKVHLYSLETGQTADVTDGWYASGSPAFSADGKYLFFVSARDFNPIYSQTEWNHAYRDMSRIYFVTLAKATPNPLRPKLDDEPAEKKDDKKDDKKDGPADVKVDLDGLAGRVVVLPGAASNYRDLASAGNALYYFRGGPQFFVFDLGTKKETALGTVNGYEISADGKKMIVSKEGKYGIIDLPKGPVTIGEALNLSGLEVALDKRAEWKQMFGECWRQMRDFFYDPGLHGVDWGAVRKKYEPLVEHVAHRADLSYVIGEMISELNAGHAYIGGGELPEVRKVQQGLLGAEYTRDAATGFFRITRILPGENWNPKRRSPLTEVGVNVSTGDWIVAVNGRPASEVKNIKELLVHEAGKPVVLSVSAKPAAEGARRVVVTPTADEADLYYYAWVRGNIKKVSDATDGRVGYIHVPDMQQAGLNEFAKHYYPQLKKQALVIDVRGNGGGNVSPMLIERLRREAAMVGIARNAEPTIDPAGTFVGPMACLLNEFSASDGDIFSYRFRHHKLGPLIGKRSWGGVVGIRGSLPLLDGGSLSKPEFSRYDLGGKEWIMENVGVAPDIVVDNDPAKEFAGDDQQLNKAVEVLLGELKKNTPKVAAPPPYPKR